MLRKARTLKAKGSGRKPSRLAAKLLQSHDPQTRREARREAFYEPVLFRELVETYRPAGRVPAMLGHALARDHGISEAAKDDAAAVFLESAQLVSVLDVDGYFVGAQALYQPGGFNLAVQEEPKDVTPPDREGHDEGEILDRQSLRVALTHRKFAELSLPVSLNEIDIALLKKQIEFLEMQAAANRSRPNVVQHPSAVGIRRES